MSLRLSGRNPLSYVGVEPLQPPDLVYIHRDPISGAVANADYRNYNVGTFWLNPDNQTLWILVKKPNNTPLWIQLGITAAGFIQTLTADNAVAVTPFGLNINVIGDPNITTVGSNLTHSVQITLNPSIAITNLTVSGNTILNNLTVNGVPIFALGQGVVQSTAGGQLFSSEGANGQILISGGPGFQPIWNTITSGDGSVIITNGAGTIDLSAVGGGGTLNTLTGNVGVATAAAGNINVETFNATVIFTGAANNLDLNFADVVAQNLVLGSSLPTLAGGNNNTGVGFAALFSLIGGDSNTGIGSNVLFNITNGNNNVALGDFAANSLVSGSDNIVIGRNAGSAVTNENNNILIGNPGVVASSNSIRIGTLGSHTSAFVQGITSVIPGSNLVTVDANGQLGITAGSGPLNTLTGNVGAAATPLAGNINIKTANSTVDFDSTPVAHQLTQDFGLTNLLLGSAGSLIAGASNNAGFGLNALNLLIGGSDNAAFGAFALSSLTNGARNTAIGFDALASVATSLDNIAIGYRALTTNTGNANTSLGSNTLNNLVSGTLNLACGYFAGAAYTTNESNNILLSNTGAPGDNGVIRIGTLGSQTSAYMQGIAGVAVANTQMVTINTATGQLGTQVIPGGGGASFFGASQATHLTGGIRYYSPYAFGGNATESVVSMIIPLNGTVNNLYCNVISNANTANGTVTVFKNGIATALSATITALTTGTFSDLVNSVGFTAGDTISFALSQATTGNCIEQISCRFLPV